MVAGLLMAVWVYILGTLVGMIPLGPDRLSWGNFSELSLISQLAYSTVKVPVVIMLTGIHGT